MKNILSFQRFFKLLNKHTKEQYKTHLMSMAVLVGILSLMMGIVAYFNGGEFAVNGQLGFFYIFLFLSGTIFTSMVFADFGDQKKSIPVLTLPVSHFERFLVGWVYSFLFFLVIFVLCFFIIDFIVISVGNINPLVKNELVSIVDKKDQFLIAFLIFGLLHATALLGAIFFEKLHFIKTAFAAFVILIVLQLINVPLINMFFSANKRMQPLFVGINLEENSRSFFITPSDFSNNIVITMFIGVTLLLWTAAFFKLKEKQV